MRGLVLIISMLFSVTTLAAIDTYEFKDEETRQRFSQLTYELRCPKCQNQNLSDSNSPIAADLRREVYRMLQEGESDSEIIDFMVARYGDFVLYKPPVNQMTYLLWYGPLVLVALGLMVMVAVSRKRKKQLTSSEEEPSSGLTTEEEDKLKKILDQDSDK